jgi:hypothetical protein
MSDSPSVHREDRRILLSACSVILTDRRPARASTHAFARAVREYLLGELALESEGYWAAAGSHLARARAVLETIPSLCPANDRFRWSR